MTFAQVAVVGPAAAQLVEGLLDDVPAVPLAALPEHGNLRGRIAGRAAIVTRVTDTGEPGFDVYVERDQAGWLKDRLAAAGAPELDEATADALRVEAGVPVFHRDMDEETIPLEAGIESRAISMTKGCYVGQEVIMRVLHRGHGRVARKLVGLTIDGDAVPAAGAPVKSGDRAAGEITSGVRSPALGGPIALAYVQRDFIAPGTRVVGERRRRHGHGVTVRGRVKQLDELRVGWRQPQRAELLARHPRISWPSCGIGAPVSRHRKKCSSTARSGYAWVTARISSPTCASTPSSSRSSRARQAACVSPGSHLPPGNSQYPSRCVPCQPPGHEHAAVAFDDRGRHDDRGHGGLKGNARQLFAIGQTRHLGFLRRRRPSRRSPSAPG